MVPYPYALAPTDLLLAAALIWLLCRVESSGSLAFVLVRKVNSELDYSLSLSWRELFSIEVCLEHKFRHT